MYHMNKEKKKQKNNKKNIAETAAFSKELNKIDEPGSGKKCVLYLRIMGRRLTYR